MKKEKHCAGCSECLASKARTGEECVSLRECRCHFYQEASRFSEEGKV